MLQQLLPLLGNAPDNLTLFIEVAAILSVIGLGLWLIGARYSRQIVTLIGVGGGAIVGKHLPEFVNLNMSAPVLAIGGALILGLFAFVAHRYWVGLGLGTVMAYWASLATWAVMHGQQSWSSPVWDADMTISRFGQELWTVLPTDVQRLLPWAAGSAMISGVALAILWPKIATALNWSLAGVSLVLCLGIATMSYARPEWIGMLPAQTWAQLSTFFGMVLFGAIVQWKLSPKSATKAPKKKEASE